MSDNMDDEFAPCLKHNESFCQYCYFHEREPMRETDCVYATQGFTCSFCGGIFPPDEFGIPVVRPLNVKPEWPPEAPRVDLLLCPYCLDSFNEASRKAKNPHFRPYTGEEMMILAAEAEEEERRFSLGLTD